jgi:hypothetical protein
MQSPKILFHRGNPKLHTLDANNYSDEMPDTKLAAKRAFPHGRALVLIFVCSLLFGVADDGHTIACIVVQIPILSSFHI